MLLVCFLGIKVKRNTCKIVVSYTEFDQNVSEGSKGVWVDLGH